MRAPKLGRHREGMCDEVVESFPLVAFVERWGARGARLARHPRTFLEHVVQPIRGRPSPLVQRRVERPREHFLPNRRHARGTERAELLLGCEPEQRAKAPVCLEGLAESQLIGNELALRWELRRCCRGQGEIEGRRCGCLLHSDVVNLEWLAAYLALLRTKTKGAQLPLHWRESEARAACSLSRREAARAAHHRHYLKAAEVLKERHDECMHA